MVDPFESGLENGHEAVRQQGVKCMLVSVIIKKGYSSHNEICSISFICIYKVISTLTAPHAETYSVHSLPHKIKWTSQKLSFFK